MNLIKSSVIIGSAIVLVLSSFTAAATTIDDPTGDVWHHTQVDSIWTWTGNVANKPNIDITSLGSTVTSDKITFTMTVAGSIENSGNIVYVLWYNSTDTSYSVYWSNGSGTGLVRGSVINISNPGGGVVQADSVTASGKTITAIFTVLGNTSLEKYWGWAVEYASFKNNTGEVWQDWAPNSEIPSYIPYNPNDNHTQDGNNTNGGSSGKKIPGFEAIFVLAAIATAAILLRRRR